MNLVYRKQLLSILLIGIAFKGFSQSEDFSLIVDGEHLIYRVTLPENFETNRKYPLILMPGFEKKGEGYSVYMGAKPQRNNWIVVESIINIKEAAFARKLVEKIKTDYNIGSVHIVGFSANSIGMFKVVAQEIELFNSVIAIPGYAEAIGQVHLKRNPNLQIVLIAGENDTYWKNKAKNAEKRLKKLGADVSLDIILNEGHIMPKFAGDPFYSLLEKRLNK